MALAQYQTLANQNLDYPPAPEGAITNETLGYYPQGQAGYVDPQRDLATQSRDLSREAQKLASGHVPEFRGGGIDDPRNRWLGAVLELPPEVAVGILSTHRVNPQEIQQAMQLRSTVGQFQTLSEDTALKRTEARARVDKIVAEASTAKALADSGGKPQWDQIEDAEGRVWERDKTGRLPARPVFLPTGTGGAREQVTKMKDIGAPELEALRENAQGAVNAARALRLLRGETVESVTGDTEATGLKGYVPDVVLQRMDTVGVPTRAAVGNIGSLRIKQRSGGAVPAAEMDRLKPFVPRETDSPDTARTKLQGFLNEYAKMMEEDIAYYKAANRRVPQALQRRAQEAIETARTVAAGTGGGIKFLGFE